ncbi:hypothetical protein GCM10008967_36960 [Bacillus carboniphilus]|uniref:DUF4829 domain-containing protein n=1 Tax=Bacillus carboniphilus TaxID=86663 RepID=A0ABN0WP12_9BACI
MPIVWRTVHLPNYVFFVFIALGALALLIPAILQFEGSAGPNDSSIPIVEVGQDNETEAKVENVDQALFILKEELDLGMTQDEVLAYFGAGYKEVLSGMEDDNQWRYDIGTIEGYSYEEEYDFADMDGMLNGLVQMHIWLTWDEQWTLKNYSALFVNQLDGRIYEYRKFEDGGEKENPIN